MSSIESSRTSEKSNGKPQRIVEISNKKSTQVMKGLDSRKRTIGDVDTIGDETLFKSLRQLHKNCDDRKSDIQKEACCSSKSTKTHHHNDATTNQNVIIRKVRKESITNNVDTNCDVCQILVNISKVYNEAGQSVQEFEFYLKCISILEKCRENIQNGNNMNDLWLCLHNLGHFFYLTHHYDEALQAFMVALNFLEENFVQSNFNHTKASILSSIGFVYFNMTIPNKDKALLYFEESLKQLNLCPNAKIDKLLLATLLNNIGKCHYVNELYDNAIFFYRGALNLRRSILGPRHLDVGATVFNIGRVYHRTGDFELACACYLYFLDTAELVFGCDSHLVITALSWLGKLHNCMQKYTDANRYYFKALKVSVKILGKGHSDITILCNRIGDTFYKMDDLDKSLEAFQSGLQNEFCSKSSCTKNIIITLLNIGNIYKEKGNVGKSIKIYQNVIKLQKKIGDPQLIKTHKILGNIISEESRYSEALVHYQEALKLYGKDYNDPQKYKSLMIMMGNIGFLTYKIGKYGQALEFLHKSLGYSEKISHECNSNDVRYILFNIAIIYNEQGQRDLAIKYFEKTLQIDKDILGPDHIDLAVCYNQIGQVYVDKGELTLALKCFEEKLRIEKLSGHSYFTTETLNMIGTLCVLTGNVHRMMGVYKELTQSNFDQISFLGNLFRYDQNRNCGQSQCSKTAAAA